MSRHIVFGTGQIGHHVVEQLVQLGHEVTAVNHNGRLDIPRVTVIAGDAADPAFATRVCAGADVVYFCLNAANYDRWAEEFPPLQRSVLEGAASAGARLVVLDNLYSYGPTDGQPLVETSLVRPSSAKSATRAAMTAELLDAHATGRVEVAIGRASDYFGPGATRSALGETVFAAALTGKAAQVMGDPDLPHSYSYTPDVAAALITLGTHPDAVGEVWHLPIAETRTTRQIIDHVYALAGQKPKSFAAGRTTLRLLGMVKAPMREYLHTLYQFDEPWVVDDSKFRTVFGDHSTPLDEALAATLEWYATEAAPDPRPTAPTGQRTARRVAAGAMAGAALLAIAGFTVLGSIFDYPKILKEPTVEILARYHENQGAISVWFAVLALSAALLAPVGVLLGRIAGPPLGRWIAGVGIAAATVQVIGLSRWFLLIPGVSDDALDPSRAADAAHTFELLHRWLGTILGETIGYALTASFTILVVMAVTKTIAGRWMAVVGYAAAGLIATGVVVPVVHVASLTNFAGYVLWCLWLIAMAVALWRSSASSASSEIG